MRKTVLLLLALWTAPLAAEGAAPVSDFYRRLGVLPGSPLKELEKAYQRTQEKLRSGQSMESRKMLRELEEIYKTLRDPDLREKYDSQLKEAGFQEEPNLYNIFGVPPESSAAEILKAYQVIRLKIHPDKNIGNTEAHRRFTELQNAHKILSDPMLRLRHDRRLRRFGGNILESLKPEEERATSPSQAATAEAADSFTVPPFRTVTEVEAAEAEAIRMWNELVMQLAGELEATGSEVDIEEAVSLYVELAQKGHVEAARRLAPLLERRDPEQAMARYKQVAEDGSGEVVREAVFRQAQIYQTGIYKNGEAVIPKDPAEAMKMYWLAFELGASSAAIAEQYDIHRDFEKAMEWRRRRTGDIPEEQSLADLQNGPVIGAKRGELINLRPGDEEGFAAYLDRLKPQDPSAYLEAVKQALSLNLPVAAERLILHKDWLSRLEKDQKQELFAVAVLESFEVAELVFEKGGMTHLTIGNQHRLISKWNSEQSSKMTKLVKDIDNCAGLACMGAGGVAPAILFDWPLWGDILSGVVAGAVSGGLSVAFATQLFGYPLAACYKAFRDFRLERKYRLVLEKKVSPRAKAEPESGHDVVRETIVPVSRAKAKPESGHDEVVNP